MSLSNLHKETAAACASGLLAALAFPRVDLAGLAWVALVPLLLVMQRRPFRHGFVAGAVFFGTVLYWLNIVMTTYGGLHPVFSLAAYLILVAYLALFWGAATWACCRVEEKLRISRLVSFPVFWVALEFVRSFFLSGFPWATYGYSQQKFLVMIQSADLCGVYGISFLLVFSNVLLARLWGAYRLRQWSAVPRWGVVFWILLFAGNLVYGFAHLDSPERLAGEPLSVALVQGNIDQSIKWDPGHQRSTIDKYLNLSRSAAEEGPVDLLVWPESATPFYFQETGPLSEAVRDFTRSVDSQLLFGSPAYEVANRQYRYLNSAFLLDRGGEILGRSDKIHLVPFGEYVPLGRFLPFIEKLVVGVGDFSPGSISPLPVNGGEIGVLVCFEGIFPDLARDYVRKGSDLLVNITNDAWFGRSSAPAQHLAMTRFRAIENRRWVARAANTGISALIAPDGTMEEQSPVFKDLFLRGEVRLRDEITLYNRLGDLLPTLFLAVSIFWLLRTRRRFNGRMAEEG